MIVQVQGATPTAQPTDETVVIFETEEHPLPIPLVRVREPRVLGIKLGKHPSPTFNW